MKEPWENGVVFAPDNKMKMLDVISRLVECLEVELCHADFSWRQGDRDEIKEVLREAYKLKRLS